jgi:hypothetical protein
MPSASTFDQIAYFFLVDLSSHTVQQTTRPLVELTIPALPYSDNYNSSSSVVLTSSGLNLRHSV